MAATEGTTLTRSQFAFTGFRPFRVETVGDDIANGDEERQSYLVTELQPGGGGVHLAPQRPRRCIAAEVIRILPGRACVTFVINANVITARADSSPAEQFEASVVRGESGEEPQLSLMYTDRRGALTIDDEMLTLAGLATAAFGVE